MKSRMGDGRRKSSESISEREVKPRSIKQNMLWNSFGSITYLASQWLITVLVVRLSSGYEAAGTRSLAMSVYNIFAPFAIYRMYTYQVFDVKRENTVGEYFAFRIITFAALVCVSFRGADLSGLASGFCSDAIFKIVGLLIDVLHGLDQVNKRMDSNDKSLSSRASWRLRRFAPCSPSRRVLSSPLLRWRSLPFWWAFCTIFPVQVVLQH